MPNQQNKHQFGMRSESGIYQDSLIDPEAEIYGKAIILDSKVMGGKIFDRSKLTKVTTAGSPTITGNANIISSFIGGLAVVTGSSTIARSLVDGSPVISDYSYIANSEVLGDSRIMDTAQVINAIVDDNAVISGNARVFGREHHKIRISGWNYIHRGTWMRPPVHKVAPLSGFTINECTEGHVDIGCICNRPEKFLRAGYRYMATLGFDKEQTDEIKDLLSDLLKEVEQEKERYKI